MCMCSQFLCSYHKQKYTQCYASCMKILVYYSQFGIWIYIITLSRCWGVAGSDVWIGTNPYSHSHHLQFMRLSFVVEPFHSWTWRYTWKLWYFATVEVGGSDCGIFLKVLFHRIANVTQNPMYQLSFHHITMSITSWVEAEWHTFACARIVLIALNFLRDVPSPIS